MKLHHRSVLLNTPFASAAALGIFLSMAPAQVAAQDNIEESFRAAHDAYDAKDYKKAIELFTKVHDALPRGQRAKAVSAYNISCSLGLSGGTPDEIFKWLERAADAGFGEVLDNPQQPGDLELVKSDGDLERVRADARFIKIVEAMAKNRKVAEDARANAPKEIAEPHYYSPAKLNPKAPAPLVVLLHGGQGNKREFLDAWKAAADEAGVYLLSLSGPEYVGPGRFGWYRGDILNAAASAGKQEKRVRAEIDAAKSKFTIDPGKVVIAGFSQGGGVAIELALRLKDVVRGAVLAAPAFSADLSAEKIKKGDAAKLRIYQIAGARDRDFPEEQAALEKLLVEAKVASKLVTLPIGHEFAAIPKASLVDSLKFIIDSGVAESKPAK